MDASTAALLGTGVGALTTLAVTVVTCVFQGRRERWQARVTTVARAAQALATLQVSMDWIIWLGEHQPHNLNDDEIHEYAGRVMPQFPKLLGAVTLLSAFYPVIVQRLPPGCDIGQEEPGIEDSS